MSLRELTFTSMDELSGTGGVIEEQDEERGREGTVCTLSIDA